MSKSTKMTITELLPQLSPEAQAEIEKVLGKDEWPKEGDAYWYIDGWGGAVRSKWDGGTLDRAHLSTGNIFRTEAEAEECTRTGWHAKLVAQTTINRFCEREGIENKWMTGGSNWYPTMSYDSGNMITECASYYRSSTIFYARTRPDAEKIITACGNEIKILLGVK